MFKKQISQMQPDGSKKVIEKGWFGKGNLLVIQGFKRDDQWVSKNYAKTGMHQLYHIDNIINNEIILRSERFTSEGGFEEDEYDY